jgi:hypothetical protein
MKSKPKMLLLHWLPMLHFASGVPNANTHIQVRPG